MPAVNREVFVLVTDTPDEAAEEALQETLARLPALEGLALWRGWGKATSLPTLPQEAGHDPT